MAKFRFRAVVIATGPYKRPVIPNWLADDCNLFQVHASAYKAPQQLPAGAVLIVGSGASGAQIAEELLACRQESVFVGGTPQADAAAVPWARLDLVAGGDGDRSNAGREAQGRTIYGYARVSTDGQTLASQDAQLHAAGCAKVYSEKASGARTDRPELAKLLRRLDEGDVLMVTRLDRLARSTRDLLNILDTVAKSRGRLQVAGGCLGGHHDGARPADADRLGRALPSSSAH